ncbi:protein vav isoform X2 [Phlebotomus argentipes]|uniref:protein vav isoform X2 n=1 Tax=Phlebotomus argentipes TaxID=94469 RepID=UPI0028932D8F|nr:protein vav isoform X2 [Phlebotomus argentipes]
MAMADDLWKSCLSWLIQCRVIPSDHKAAWPDSEIKVLALTLRDGVILCNLINFLDPNALDMKDFHRKPQMAQFLCCQNIKLFLETCKNHFALRDSDLFEPTMLYDLTNFHRVLITLSKLSQCRKVQQLHPNILGFNAQLSPSERSHSEEDIYKDLHSTTTDNAVVNGNHDEHDMKEEEVYQDLCSIQRRSRNQVSSSTSFEQRDFVIRELVDTESNYLDVLNALRYKFMQPMEKLLSKEDIKLIFPKVRELADIHTKFLEKLREAVQPGAKLKLSQVFFDFREPFLIYGEYCSNMTNATDALRDQTAKSESMRQLVNQCQKEHSEGRVQLRDILSVPMQRILKYHLLLKKLVDETSPTHEDFRGLERAKEAMDDVAQYINEVKRDSEHLVVIQKVRESIMDLDLPYGNDLQQYGRLLLDGDLNIKAHEDQKTKHRYAFIFEKVMILVKTSSTRIGDGQYSFREAHNLQEYRVELCHSRRTLTRDARLRFQLLLVRKTQSTAFTLYMKTEAERNKWSKALQDAMDNLDPPGCRNTDHKFVITTFDEPAICRHCSKFLKGRIHQGYRCKTCEISVHKGCISSTGRCRQGPVSLPPPVCDRQLSEFYWFVGTMDRDTATSSLENRRIGTYLLRVRPQGASNPNETMYALSLKTDKHVIKHMKIYQKRDSERDSVSYYLSTRRYFKTIIELVSFYERNDLGENFAGLNQSLQWPFREVIATALYEFVPDEQNQLPLRKGCQVIVIGKEGDSKGWWRGKTNERVGFFPKEYVREHPMTPDGL